MTDSSKWFVFVMILITLGLVYLLGPVLMPFLISFLLAYFLDPLMVKLRRLKIPRIISATLVFIIVIALILAVLLNIIPAIEKQSVMLIHRIPDIINWAQATLVPWVEHRFDIQLNFDASLVRGQVMQHINSNGSHVAKTVMQTIFNSSYLLIEVLMNLILIPIVTIYILVDWEKITREGKLLLPFSSKKRDIAVGLIRECGDVLAGFLRGQLLVMIGLAIVYSAGLSIVGLDLALLIGLISGTLSIVPYLGFFSGLLIAVITAAIQYHDWIHIIYVLIVFSVGEVCESLIFSPLFVGDRIGLHPVAVIFAVLAGGKLFGFVGVLLALPVAAIIMVFFRYLQRRYFAGEAA